MESLHYNQFIHEISYSSYIHKKSANHFQFLFSTISSPQTIPLAVAVICQCRFMLSHVVFIQPPGTCKIINHSNKCIYYLSYIHLGSSVCLSSCHIPSCRPVILSSCHICGTLSYSLCLRIQTDRLDETEGFEREGLQMER